MKLKAFFKGRQRREYAPFGKSWKFSARFETAGFIIFLALTVFFTAICSLSGSATIVISCISLYILILLLLAYEFRDNIYSLISLGSMTDSEYETLCREYREFKQKNIVRYGVITSYGIVSDDGMLPWSKIAKIKITPKIYAHRQTNPPMIRYSLSKSVIPIALKVCLDQEYDLSDEIERFLDIVVKHTDPHCLIENEYYYEQ